jgi:DNA-binding transcriptional MocR family regulator
VVDVQHHALRAFEQDALAGLHLLVQQLPDRLGVGQDLRRDVQQVAISFGVHPALAEPARSAL